MEHLFYAYFINTRLKDVNPNGLGGSNFGGGFGVHQSDDYHSEPAEQKDK
ncbi:MAG: hypothetical protein HY072_08205 [Deltaproteobacteria bacterium]|nr:hypothetical protein [Deltaproteobacteria bacterium]